MQPTYLPWLGYFDLIAQTDLFVFLDNVQFEHQSWQQRNRIKTRTGPQWLTVPVQHSFGQLIQEVRIVSDQAWRRRHYQALISNYGHAPYWRQYESEIRALYNADWVDLVELNIRTISVLSLMAGVPLKSIRASSLGPPTGRKGAALVELCRRAGARAYLSPIGALAYLQGDPSFEEAGIALLFQQYEHPGYPQLHGAFLPFLSIVDLLLNTGSGAAETVVKGRRPPKTAAQLDV